MPIGARAAAASDPALNYHFSRRWCEPPSKDRPVHSMCKREINNKEEIERVFARFVDFPKVSAA